MINQITTMRLPDGTEVAFVDWQDKPLFSSVDLLANFTDTEVDAFTYVVGDEVPATVNAGGARRLAIENDTSVSTPASMASTEEMLVYAIKPEVLESELQVTGDPTSGVFAEGGQPTPMTNRLAVLNNFLLLQLIVSQKIEQSATLAYFNTGFSAFSGAAADAAAATAISNRGSFGFPTQEAVRSFVIPIHIGGQEKYRVTLRNARGVAVPSGQNGATPPVSNDDIMHTVRIHLDGLYKRPVS
jgi:hypothetical protein